MNLLTPPEGSLRIEPYKWFRDIVPSGFGVEAFRYPDGKVCHAVVTPVVHVDMEIPEDQPVGAQERLLAPMLSNLRGFLELKIAIPRT